MNLIEIVVWFLYNISSFFCHQLPERSFFIAEYKLPVCARCTGIYLGAFFSYLLLPFLLRNKRIRVGVLDTLIYILPLAVDGLLQLLGLGWRNNYTRLITGALAASSTALFAVVLALSLFFDLFKMEAALHDSTWLKTTTKLCFISATLTVVVLVFSLFSGSFLVFIMLSIFLAHYAILHNVILPIIVVFLTVIYLLRSPTYST
ncbi:MAG: hypothetical protein DRJ52_04965 [Thermoprotei archaeon]|nr:MAG: hypothetical protein DRJ52_04965 [Thermoprotei archaeon]RLE99131.1 MAG: hypothetical protein DRJ63_06260 [Thermoprotei archaeon]